MSELTPPQVARQVVPPQKKAAPPAQTGTNPGSNAAMQERMQAGAGDPVIDSNKVISGSDGLASDNPLHTRQGGGRSASNKRPKEHKLTQDPFGLGYQHTTESTQVVDKQSRKKRKLPEKRRSERTHRAAQVVGGNVQLNHTTVQDRTRGKKVTSSKESTHGVELNTSNLADSKYTHSRSTTDDQGTNRTGAFTVGRDGAAYTRSVERNGVTRSFGVHGNPLEREVGIHGGVGKKFKNGNSVGVNGHFTAKLPGIDTGTLTKGQEGSGTIHDDALRLSGADQIKLYGESNALSVGLGVNAKLGVVGLQANGFYANESSANFYSSKLTDTQMKARGEEMIRTPEGDRVSKLEDMAVLDRTGKDGQQLSGLQRGESVSLQSASSKGGGGGISVYGVGVAGSGSTESVQRTVASRDPKSGAYTLDITTTNLNKASGEAQLGGGVAAAGYEANWGEGRNINLRFEDTESGRSQMKEFMKTGMIPGAMGKRDPERETYQRLAAKDKLSKAERAQLDSIAQRVNQSYMDASAFEATDDTNGDVQIRTSVGKNKSSEIFTKVLGNKTSSSKDTHYNERRRYDEHRINQVSDGGHYQQDRAISAEESYSYDLNPEGRRDTHIEATARNWKGEHANEFESAGKRYPNRGSGNAGEWFDGKKGVSDASLDFDEREIGKFQEHAKNLDLTSLTKSDRQAVTREADLRRKANAPISGEELATHMARKQASAELAKIMDPSDREFASIVEEQTSKLLAGDSDAYLDGKTPEEMMEATNAIRAPRLAALEQGRASELQHALAAIQSGGDYTAADYATRRALLDRVVAEDAGTEDLKGVTFDNDTWQTALGMLSNGKGKTDRARVIHGILQSDIENGKSKSDTNGSSANRVFDTITHVFPDIGELPQHDRGQDMGALKRFINGRISMKRR